MSSDIGLIGLAVMGENLVLFLSVLFFFFFFPFFIRRLSRAHCFV